MPFVPHTEADVAAMLATIGADSIEALFDEIPPELRAGSLGAIPPALSEMEIGRLMASRANADGQPLCFIGAGAYDHHVPAAVWQIASRGEFYSAYTPYQAEASQGTLQLLYEFQSMMTALTGLDVSNASLYDGASALAEAVLMAVRANRKAKSNRVLIPRALHPDYRAQCTASCTIRASSWSRSPLIAPVATPWSSRPRPPRSMMASPPWWSPSRISLGSLRRSTPSPTGPKRRAPWSSG